MNLYLVMGNIYDGEPFNNNGCIPFAEYVFSDDAIAAAWTVVDFVTKGERKLVKDYKVKTIVPQKGLILD